MLPLGLLQCLWYYYFFFLFSLAIDERLGMGRWTKIPGVWLWTAALPGMTEASWWTIDGEGWGNEIPTDTLLYEG
jgi:hypothetical protein